MNKDRKKATIKAALKAKNVNIVNVPKVQIVHEDMDDKPRMPTIRLTDEQLPEIKDWKVGETYTVTVKMRQTSMSQGDEYDIGGSDSKKVCSSFKITSVKVV